MKAYQLKIQIKGSHPPIWRRIVVPSGLTFSQLGVIINEAVGWSSSHLCSFEFPKLGINVLDMDEDYESFENFGPLDTIDIDASKYAIDTFLEHENKFLYIYDFGDWWVHIVTVEQVIEFYDHNYAQIIKFKGDTPPEDCGGIDGYYELLDILADPDAPNYQEIKEWADNIEPYSVDAANDTLEYNLYLSEDPGQPMYTYDLCEQCILGPEPFYTYRDALNLDNAMQEKEEYLNSIIGARSFVEDFSSDEHISYWDFEMEIFNQVINKPHNIKDILESYRKEELATIAKVHDLKGYSHLNKSQLVDFIIDHILSPDGMNEYLKYLPEEIIDFLGSKEYAKIIDSDLQAYMPLVRGGYATFKDMAIGDVIVVAADVKRMFNKYKKEDLLDLNGEESKLLTYLNGTSRLYGVYPIDNFTKLFNEIAHMNITKDNVILFNMKVPGNLTAFVLDGDNIVTDYLHDNGYTNAFEALQEEIDTYYVPPADHIEHLGNSNYLPFNPEEDLFRNYIYDNTIADDSLSDEIVKSVQSAIRAGIIPEDVMILLDNIFESYGMDKKILSASDFADIFDTLFRSTRISFLKGHTFDEIDHEDEECFADPNIGL